eukprot:s2577_g13.t1
MFPKGRHDSGSHDLEDGLRCLNLHHLQNASAISRPLYPQSLLKLCEGEVVLPVQCGCSSISLGSKDEDLCLPWALHHHSHHCCRRVFLTRGIQKGELIKERNLLVLSSLCSTKMETQSCMMQPAEISTSGLYLCLQNGCRL